MRVRWIVVVLLVLLPAWTTAADDGPDRLLVRSSAPVAMSGSFRAETSGGALAIVDEDACGVRTLRGLDGTLSVWEWTTGRLEVRSVESVTVRPQTSDAVGRAHELRNATLEIRLDCELFYLSAVAIDGGFVVASASEEDGAPVWLPRRVQAWYGDGPYPYRRPPDLLWAWEEGWQLLGSKVGEVRHEGFPVARTATVGMHGAFLLQVQGGNATFRDTGGAEHTVRLGWWDAPGAAPAGRVVSTEERRARLLFEGTVESADVAASDDWGLAAPDVVWKLDGRLVWRAASGEAHVRGGSRTFDGSDVEAIGAFEVRSVAPESLALAPATYRASGSFSRVLVDGVAVEGASPPSLGQAAPYAALLAALAILWKLLAAMYTRLSADAIASHPARRRILDIVRAEPGIHLSELRRRVGGAWGPFTYHVRRLSDANLIRVEREGKYRRVSSSDAPPAEVLVPPVARTVYDALPSDGSPLATPEIARRIGISRQLTNYHLRGLVARGLVIRTAADGRPRYARPQR